MRVWRGAPRSISAGACSGHLAFSGGARVFLARLARLLAWCGWGRVPPPLFFCCCRPFFWIAGRKAAAWGECLVSSFCVKGVVVVAGFHVGVRVRLLAVWCGVVRRAGACRLVGADGEPTPHFGSVAEGEAFLADRDAASRGGFTGSAVSAGGAGVVSGAVGDGRAVAWDDARACVGSVSVPNGALVLGPSAAWGAPARLVRGLVGAEPLGNLWLVPVQGRAFGDDVDVRGVAVVESARDVAFAHVTGGALVGEARGVQVWERVRGRHGGGSETLFCWECWWRRGVAWCAWRR